MLQKSVSEKVQVFQKKTIIGNGFILQRFKPFFEEKGYKSLAIELLVVSDDHLLNWFLYPNEFKSRNARHSSFKADRRVRDKEKIISYPLTVIHIRDRILYLPSETSIKEAVSLTDLKIKEIFRRAENVRSFLKKL
ncbi:MAG: hypothetical protein ACE5J9_04590 [Methanosarcinales archaeon]